MKRTGIGLIVSCLVAAAHGQVDFSHDAGTAGAPGSAVNASPDVGEVFSADGVSNILVGDLASLGLAAGDNIDALTRGDISNAPSGVLAFPFLFSVEPGAVGEQPYPVWAEAPFNAADVYGIEAGSTGHVLAYNEPALGLATRTDESIDAMTIPQLMDGVRIYFSLQQGSPTLLGNAWSGADVLTVVVGAPGTLERAISASAMGLIPADEIDGLAIYGRMDANGNGVFDDAFDYAAVYFSVDETSVGAIGSEVRMRSQNSPFHGGDIYHTALNGGHQLLYEADGLIRLGAGDVLDAIKQGSLDQADPFPMYRAGGPDPAREPRKPASCPPYRGIGVPIGCLWIEICDTPLPGTVNWSVKIKMCKADGTTMEICVDDTINGLGNTNPDAKGDEIAKIFAGLTFPKPGEDPDKIPLFVEVSKSVPPVNVMGNNITGEVGMLVNQEVIDCGWNVDAVCFSFTNWTASIIAKPVMGWFPDPIRTQTIEVEGVAEEPGVVRITSRDAFGNPGSEIQFIASVVPGMPGSDALFPIAQQINDSGGSASINADGLLRIERLAQEPPIGEDGTSGPLIIENGALAVPSLRVTTNSWLARGPLSPCSPADISEPFGELDFFDISGFLQAFMDGSPEADLAWDGMLNFFDLSTFLQLLSQGCPADING